MKLKDYKAHETKSADLRPYSEIANLKMEVLISQSRDMDVCSKIYGSAGVLSKPLEAVRQIVAALTSSLFLDAANHNIKRLD